MLESSVVHNKVLAIFKQVEPGEDRTVLHAQRFKDAVKEATADNAVKDIHQAVRVASRTVGQDGASQYTLLGVIDGILRGVCVGESRLMVIRNGAVEFESPRFIGGFKEPMTNREVASGACEPAVFQFQLAEGDVIVFGCDGLWDNVEMDMVAGLVDRAVRGAVDYEEASESSERGNIFRFNLVFRRIERDLTRLIRRGMRDRDWFSPYAQDGMTYGTRTSGGRADSCCVFMSIVVDGTTWSIPADWPLSALSV